MTRLPYIGARYVHPVRLPFPIWTYGPRYGALDGHYIGEGWEPNWYATREVPKPL